MIFQIFEDRLNGRGNKGKIEIELESCPLLSHFVELNVTINIALGIGFFIKSVDKSHVLHMLGKLEVEKTSNKQKNTQCCQFSNQNIPDNAMPVHYLISFTLFFFFSSFKCIDLLHLYNHFIPKIITLNFYNEKETISFVWLYKFCTRK